MPLFARARTTPLEPSNNSESGTQSPLTIHYVNIDNLKPSEYNPRKMSEDQAAELTKSIERFGMIDPIIVNQYPGRENVIVGGHMRYNIALSMKIPAVPCVFVYLDVNAEKELNLRLNRNLGEWDYDLLANLEQELLTNAGFSEIELGDIFKIGEKFEPAGEDEQGKLDEKQKPIKVICPECGHEFTA